MSSQKVTRKSLHGGAGNERMVEMRAEDFYDVRNLIDSLRFAMLNVAIVQEERCKQIHGSRFTRYGDLVEVDGYYSSYTNVIW